MTDFLNSLDVLSSTGLVGGIFDLLGDAASWAGAVANLMDLL